MTIHETAAKLAAVNAKIADMAQTSADECIRMAARIQELEGALKAVIAGCKSLPENTIVPGLGLARSILAKGN